jgi:hypothetical protein
MHWILEMADFPICDQTMVAMAAMARFLQSVNPHSNLSGFLFTPISCPKYIGEEHNVLANLSSHPYIQVL